jgi:hypothetical protein
MYTHRNSGRDPEADEGIRRWAEWVRPKLELTVPRTRIN